MDSNRSAIQPLFYYQNFHMYTFGSSTLILLLLLSFLSTIYLYSYPIFHGCSFPVPQYSSDPAAGADPKKFSSLRPLKAPFRLLAFGDPQLEGDSSLLSDEKGFFPSLQNLQPDLSSAHSPKAILLVIRSSVIDLFRSDFPQLLRFYRKRLDLLGNDFYLAHIYRTLHWFTNPTHVTVLGDLIGSQWVSDEEFERRGRRFWRRIFRHGQRIEDQIVNGFHSEVLGRDKSWETRIINIAGNHDVGYAGDMTEEMLARFEKVFGKANWETRFSLYQEHGPEEIDPGRIGLPELRIIVLNSLNLDTPAISEALQANTYNFINAVIGESRPVEDRTTLTIVLTHLPLHKEAGICTDSPYFEFHPEERGGGVKVQNHLSYNAGKGILEGIFGMNGNPDASGKGLGRNGIILTGHDHEGCDVYHFLPCINNEEPLTWKTEKWNGLVSLRNKTVPGVREITLRSMMGEFGGNAGLLSAWFDYDVGEWKFETSMCRLGIQHVWWAIHVFNILALGLCAIFGIPCIGTWPGGHIKIAKIRPFSKPEPKELVQPT